MPADDTTGAGPSYLSALQEQGVISRAMFGLYLTPNEEFSNIQIGNYNESYINGTTSDITWYDNSYDDEWVLAGFTNYGETPHELESTDYVIDSGNRKIGFPTTMWNNFVSMLESDSDTIVCDENTCYGQEEDCRVYDPVI